MGPSGPTRSSATTFSMRVSTARARRSLLIFAVGNPLYVLAIGASLLSATLALVIYALLALFYLFDVLPPLKQGDKEKGATET